MSKIDEKAFNHAIYAADKSYPGNTAGSAWAKRLVEAYESAKSDNMGDACTREDQAVVISQDGGLSSPAHETLQSNAENFTKVVDAPEAWLKARSEMEEGWPQDFDEEKADDEMVEALISEIEVSLDYFRDEFPKNCEKNNQVWTDPISYHCGGVSPDDLQAILSILHAMKPKRGSCKFCGRHTALEQNLESMRQTNAALVNRLQEREAVQPIESFEAWALTKPSSFFLTEEGRCFYDKAREIWNARSKRESGKAIEALKSIVESHEMPWSEWADENSTEYVMGMEEEHYRTAKAALTKPTSIEDGEPQ